MLVTSFKVLSWFGPILAIVIEAAIMAEIFSSFHYVYTGEPSIFFAVFLSGLVLGISYKISNRPVTPMLAHILVNVR